MKILLAIDSSPYAEMAVATLNALKLSLSSTIHVVNVVPDPVFIGGISLHRLKGVSIDENKQHEAQRLKAHEILDKFVNTLRESDLNADGSVMWGRPAEQIIRRSAEIEADLIVVGARGESHPHQFPLGGVANKVLKYADTSVLLVKERTKSFRRVVVATDGSKHSDIAVEFLLRLPLPRMSHVFILTSLQSHIAAWIKTPTLNIDINRKLLSNLQEAEEEKAQSLLDETKRRFEDRGYEAFSMLLKGEPAAEILMSADTLHPDLIAVGAKGLSGGEPFPLGSVAQRIARFSKYSVLVCKGRNSAQMKV